MRCVIGGVALLLRHAASREEDAMGVDIRLEDEHGKRLDEVGDPSNLLHRLLPSADDESFACLRFVDPYGNTVFNKAQSEILISEIERIRVKAGTHHEQEFLDGIRRLAEHCRSETHLYLKFYGD